MLTPKKIQNLTLDPPIPLTFAINSFLVFLLKSLQFIAGPQKSGLFVLTPSPPPSSFSLKGIGGGGSNLVLMAWVAHLKGVEMGASSTISFDIQDL